MDRFTYLRHYITKAKVGLEIGPSFNPVAAKRDGWNVQVVDHATREQLAEKYREHAVDVSKIEDVDWVWGKESLENTIGESHLGSYDYIIASHVVEHMPDLLGFFTSAQKLLKPTGILSVAVPDKRYCFDLFKPLTTAADVLYAQHQGLRRHTKKTVFEHFAYSMFRNGIGAWNATPDGEYSLAHTLEFAKDRFDFYVENPEHEYVDFHRSYFVPSSFELLILELRAIGETTLDIVQTFPSVGCEFFVSLQQRKLRSSTPAAIDAERLELMKRSMREVALATESLKT